MTYPVIKTYFDNGDLVADYGYTYANPGATFANQPHTFKAISVEAVNKNMQSLADAARKTLEALSEIRADLLTPKEPPKPEPLVCTDCHATLRTDQVACVGGLPYCRYCDHRASLNVSCRENDDHGFDRLAETPQRGAQVKADNSFWDE